ncbi:MAG: site-specific integrase [Anaerolineales bacterium]|nr:site-specific integrase [Anaerolineales bacterium]
MINKKNWQLTKKYLDYRLRVDQITKGSMGKEQTHMRYALEWAQETSFQQVPSLRPTFTEHMLTSRLDGENGQLSAVYIKKVLATARLFFVWLSDNHAGYGHIKQAWIKTIKVKRLSDIPKNKEIVSLEEIFVIANTPVYTVQEKRTRAALVFLYLSGMRIGAFVSLPVGAVDIPNRFVNQFPSMGVRTKNRKFAKTYLLDIPELLKVVQDWDNEVRSLIGSNGFWFALLSSDTGEILPGGEIGEHRKNLARRNFKDWFSRAGLAYHSPHKFRHGHIHYGLERSKSISDFKAVSMNAMHATMEITDQFYSVLHDDEVKNRISSLSGNSSRDNDEDEIIDKFKRFLEWEKQNKEK